MHAWLACRCGSRTLPDHSQTDRAVSQATGYGPPDQARATSTSLDKPR